jgi:carbohydrate kinase (thermoresistant glucokinase family)
LVIIVMGISGCGKSTVGGMLSERMGMHFAEGDAYHPPANVDKMSKGQPLNDDDRMPWLKSMADDIKLWADQDIPAVLSCSALKKSYRTILTNGNPKVRLVHLHGNPDIVRERMSKRVDHFMPPSLIDSQIATLEIPELQERVLTLDIAKDPVKLVEQIIAAFDLASFARTK